jgi:hypothetical protein
VNNKRETKRGIIFKETHIEAQKDDLDKPFNLRKSCAKYSVNFVELQRFFRRFKVGSGNKFLYRIIL